MDGVRVRSTPCFARPDNQTSDPGLGRHARGNLRSRAGRSRIYPDPLGTNCLTRCIKVFGRGYRGERECAYLWLSLFWWLDHSLSLAAMPLTLTLTFKLMSNKPSAGFKIGTMTQQSLR
jgi:hypothetical protein